MNETKSYVLSKYLLKSINDSSKKYTQIYTPSDGKYRVGDMPFTCDGYAFNCGDYCKNLNCKFYDKKTNTCEVLNNINAFLKIMDRVI